MSSQALPVAAATVQLELKPFRCRSCKTVFGLTDGQRLYIGEVCIFTLQVVILCGKCGATGKWRPLLGGIRKGRRPIIRGLPNKEINKGKRE